MILPSVGLVVHDLFLYNISDIYQERIVKEGGLDALLSLLLTSQHTTILRVASGALANLAMNGRLILLIVSWIISISGKN